MTETWTELGKPVLEQHIRTRVRPRRRSLAQVMFAALCVMSLLAGIGCLLYGFAFGAPMVGAAGGAIIVFMGPLTAEVFTDHSS